jgi:hypothetical protein
VAFTHFDKMLEKVNFKNKVFLEGNMTLLTKYYQALYEKSNVKIAFFGDTYISDITSTEEFNQKIKNDPEMRNGP